MLLIELFEKKLNCANLKAFYKINDHTIIRVFFIKMASSFKF